MPLPTELADWHARAPPLTSTHATERFESGELRVAHANDIVGMLRYLMSSARRGCV
jgi:hypothetical protein